MTSCMEAVFESSELVAKVDSNCIPDVVSQSYFACLLINLFFIQSNDEQALKIVMGNESPIDSFCHR